MDYKHLVKVLKTPAEMLAAGPRTCYGSSTPALGHALQDICEVCAQLGNNNLIVP